MKCLGVTSLGAEKFRLPLRVFPYGVKVLELGTLGSAEKKITMEGTARPLVGPFVVAERLAES